MNADIWNVIEERFRRRPQTKASPVLPAEFDLIVGAAAVLIDPDYREFVLRYGGGLVGSSPIYGLRRAEFMGTIGGKSTAPEITTWFQAKGWPGVEGWFIFSVDQGGNPIGFAQDGTVWLSDQTDFQEVVQLAFGFEDYLLKWCLKTKKAE